MVIVVEKRLNNYIEGLTRGTKTRTGRITEKNSGISLTGLILYNLVLIGHKL